MELLVLFITISLLLWSAESIIPQGKCNRLKIGDIYYQREVLWANLGRPYNLNVFKPTNTIFFSYSVPETYSDADFQLAYYNIDSREYQIIAGIRGGCTVAIDTANDDIYMGGSDGIYKHNMLTKIADYYKEKGKNIWSLFFKDNLFYISYPDQRLHIEMDGKFVTVKEFENFEIDHFFVSSARDIIFANKTGLYKFDSDTKKVIVVNELVTVRQISEDMNGNLYISTNFGILLDGKYDSLKKILDHKNIFGLTFDKDNNFIISDERSIIRLLPSSEGCGDNDKNVN